MRRTYVVVLELQISDGEEVSSDITALLESIGYTLRLSEHAYMLASVDSATVIRDAIKNSPFDVERIFVSEVSSPAAWRNLLAENNEIKAFLRDEH